MTERTLDWRPKPDIRSQAFRFAAVPTCSVTSFRESIMRTKTIWLDQGEEGACTGFGEENVQALSPFPQETSDETARMVYYGARKEDEWPGEDYEGSSVNGAMKAARKMGRIVSWYWAYTLGELLHGVSYHGAGEFGTWWYSGMWETDAEGFIHATGDRVGGHAIAYAGYRLVNGQRRHRLENSWGPDWGDRGGCWLTEADFLSLLNDEGELAFPRKVRL